MIHGRTRFIYAHLLLVASFFVEGTQAAQAHVLAARQRGSNAGSPTSSPPSSSTSPTPTNFFALVAIPQATTCESTILSWVYRGTADSLSLQVSDVGQSQNSTSSPLTSFTSSTSSSDDIVTSIRGRSIPHPFIRDITLTIATNITPSSGTFLWDPVNVPQGRYVISAIPTPMTPLTEIPISFVVQAGTDTSCLSASSSSASSTRSTSIKPSSVTTATPTTSQAAADSTSLSTASNHLNVPVIVGVTVGMTVFVIAIALLWLCLYRKAKSQRRGGRFNTFAHRWNGLGSTDSRTGFAAKATSKQKFLSSRSHLQSHSNSVASTMGPDSEKSTTQLNVNGKTLNLSDEQGVALSTLPVLYHQSQRTRATRSHSESSSASNVNDFSPGVKGQRSSQRRPSIDSPSAYPPATPILHQPSHQPSSHSISPQSSLPPPPPPPPPPPISPSAAASREIKQMNRQSLGRKRKPVPAYDSNLEQPASATSPTFVPPLPASTTTNGDSPAVPSLTHKSSFGPGGIEGKQLHYLIPDMPMRSGNP